MSGRDFSLVFGQGKAYREDGISLHVLRLEDRPGDRLVGFAVSRKVGNAVVRNLVRRRLRHAVRSLSTRMERGVMLAFTARPRAAETEYSRLAAAVERVLVRAGLLASTAASPLSRLEPGPSS